jgi:hypothetical protein
MVALTGLPTQSSSAGGWISGRRQSPRAAGEIRRAQAARFLPGIHLVLMASAVSAMLEHSQLAPSSVLSIPDGSGRLSTLTGSGRIEPTVIDQAKILRVDQVPSSPGRRITLSSRGKLISWSSRRARYVRRSCLLGMGSSMRCVCHSPIHTEPSSSPARSASILAWARSRWKLAGWRTAFGPGSPQWRTTKPGPIPRSWPRRIPPVSLPSAASRDSVNS